MYRDRPRGTAATLQSRGRGRHCLQRAGRWVRGPLPHLWLQEGFSCCFTVLLSKEHLGLLQPGCKWDSQRAILIALSLKADHVGFLPRLHSPMRICKRLEGLMQSSK